MSAEPLPLRTGPMLLRIVPAGLVVRRPQRMIERHLVAYRRQWLIIVSGFFEPLFYLLSMRVGVGALVGDVSVGGRLVAYDQFVAPALMAASAMNGAIFDSTGNVLHRLKYARLYDAALATPMRPADVAMGEIGWAIGIVVYGTVVVFIADHFVRPVLIGGSTRLPFVAVLLGIIGGIQAWGLIGLVLGPALMAALLLLWREWVGEQDGPLAPQGDEAGA
jgi:hypothetical protein